MQKIKYPLMVLLPNFNFRDKPLPATEKCPLFNFHARSIHPFSHINVTDLRVAGVSDRAINTEALPLLS
jgi:hypothetical protein